MRTTLSVLLMLLIIILVSIMTPHLPAPEVRPGWQFRASVSDNVTITTEQDFENGTLENVNASSHPGDLVLEKEYFTYTVGQLDSPSSTYYGGYTLLPGDSDFVMRSDGVVKKITINVGGSNGPFKVKILRNAGGNNFYAVATSQEFYPQANAQNSYNVNLPVKEGDRLGIFTDGELSVYAPNGDTGMWWHFGEVQGDTVEMNWDSSTSIVTIQATVLGERYIHYGNWTSQVIELTDMPTRIAINWDATLFADTSIKMYARTSSDGIIWGPWQEVVNGGLVDNPQKYIMVWAQLQGTDSVSPVLHSITINYDYNINGLVINEISSYGSGNDEWVEIYNSGKDMDIAGLQIDDQDGNAYTVPSDIGTMPHDSYLLIYFGSGTDDKDFSDGLAVLYANFSANVLNDNGDDVVLSIGGNPIDYVAFWSNGLADVDSCPTGLEFTRDGSGYNGYAPAPRPGESISLIPNGIDDDLASEWYITRGSAGTPGGKNANLLTVSGRDIAPAQARQYTSVAVIEMKLTALGSSGDYVSLRNIVVERNGTASDEDIPQAYIYQDSDMSGDFSSSDTLQAQVAFDNGTANFSISIGVNCGQTVTYFIVVKVDENANTSAFANFTLSSVEVDPGNVFSFTPVTTRNVDIIQRDQTPPQVSNIFFSPSPPVGVGNLNISIYFSEPMNTSVPLKVSFGPGGYEHQVAGTWDGSTVWKGSTYISSSTENGELRLIIEDGEDLAGNVMSPNPYVTTFVVDTIPPKVSGINFSSRQPFGIGTYIITIEFNEEMDTYVNPTVKYGITNMNYVSGRWQDSRTWVGTLTVGDYSENGRNTLYIQDAKDLAGNRMEMNVSYIEIDTTMPYVSMVEFNRTQPFGIGYYSVTVYFSEDMNTSVQPQVSFGVTHTYQVVGNWISTSEWWGTFRITSQNDNGKNTLLIRNAQDRAGNTMGDYRTQFVVDTTPPEVEGVEINPVREAYRAGNYEVTITFNEAMNTSITLNVSYGIHSSRPVAGIWVSNTTWRGTLSIPSNAENGENSLRVSGGEDLAGNRMNDYQEFNFEIDTLRPNATVILEDDGPFNSTSIIEARIVFSEPVSSPKVLVDSIPVNATPLSGDEYSDTYVVTIYAYLLSDGEHRISVRDAHDVAGNVMETAHSRGFVVDKTPPSLSLDFKRHWVEGDTLEIVAHVSDDTSNITSVILRYRFSSGKSGEVRMEYVGSGDYIGRIPNVEPGRVSFEVIVRDSAGNVARESGYVEVQTFIMANLWLWIILAVVISVAIVALMVHMRRRRMKGLPALGIMERFRKEESEEEEFYEDFD